MGIILTNGELWKACGPFPQDSGEARKAANAATAKAVKEIDKKLTVLKYADTGGGPLKVSEWKIAADDWDVIKEQVEID